MIRVIRPLAIGLSALLVLVALGLSAHRPDKLEPAAYAVRGARVVLEPGKVLPRATVVVRDGLIEAVGPDVKVPADATVIEGKDLTVYPGLVDGMSNWGFDASQRRSDVGDPATEDLSADALAATKPDNRKGVTPEFSVRKALTADAENAEAWRKVGFTSHLVAPDGGILLGQSAVVSLSGAPAREAVLRDHVAQHLAFRPASGTEYPRVLMGIIAHARQTLLDAGLQARLIAAFENGGRAGKRPPADPALEALAAALDGKQPVVIEADTHDEIDRALNFAAEFKLRPILFGGKDAYKAIDRIKREKVAVLLRIDFSEPATGFRRGGFGRPQPTPNPTDPATPAQRPGRGRRNPQANPATPAVPGTPAAAQAPERTQRDLPPRVREDQRKQQARAAACAAALHKAGIPFAICSQGLPPDRPWEQFRTNLRKVIDAGLPADAALQALTTQPARILGVSRQVGAIAAGRPAHLIVTDGDFHLATTRVRHVFADSAHFEYDATTPTPRPRGGAGRPTEDKTAPKLSDNSPTELDEDRKPATRTGGNVLLKGATVLPVSGNALRQTDILVTRGKIAAIGKNLTAPEGTQVIDLAGLFVMPGIIDTHCHFAVSGGVNEGSLSVVPEVRVRDVINSEDVQIYRALAGGVTLSRLLHGSANVIGGQDAVIKLKYGRPASELLVADAPRGVKFALGENVKRTDGRFPNTRLGVEAVLVRAFTEARDYQKKWSAYRRARAEGTPAVEPRRDLRLEALSDVLSGDLRIHCHCYRADEILMLLRVCEKFGVKVRSLQHVLEGYKVAPEIARHGASCSPFSDWWAYKWEAADAIPFTAALLHEAGVSVCLKSDSNELMRHMYQEAAKCVKYGGMSERDALAAITLNGARQLGLEKRTGSIEVGKDADLAVFNGHPLNSYSRCEMTLVDGEVYFQRQKDLKPFKPAAAAPARPVAKLPVLPASGDHLFVVGATVHPVTGPAVANATLEIRKGEIVAVHKERVPTNGAARIDAQGLHVYPGMIDAGSVLGLVEVDSARETRDHAESGDFQPDLRASTGINPDSELIPVTRANGVLSVVTRPTGGVIAGQSALIRLSGWVPGEMALVDPLALHVELPGGLPGIGRGSPFGRASTTVLRRTREAKLKKLRELFKQALTYDAGRRASSDAPTNPRLEALAPYARGEKPVVIQATRLTEVREALKLADDLKIKVVISGGLDAWKVAGELKKRDIPVLVGPVLTLPSERFDPYDAPYACAARLHAEGVRFCIRSKGDSNTRNLPYEAAMAVSYGLPPEEGLKAVTLYPAQILGVADQLGSIERGRRANLVLTNGDMLQASTQVVGLLVDGKPLPPTSKHTRLYERYRGRLAEVRGKGK